MKQVGDFIYFYSEDEGTVIISYVATLYHSLSELTVKLKLLGKMFMVEDAHINIEYQGKIYPGITYYNNVNEQELIEALSSTK